MYPFPTPVFCSCLDESQQKSQKVLFIPHTFFQGQMEQKCPLPDFCWIPFTKRYTFCFESMLRLCNCKKLKTAIHFSFNLTLVKHLRDEKRKIGYHILQKPFLLGNLSFLIRFRYTFSGFPGIPSTDSTKRYHFCFKCMHDFDCARNAKKPGRRFRTKSMQLPRWIFCEIFENRVSSRRGIPMRKWGN